jgi:hypothetical protein
LIRAANILAAYLIVASQAYAQDVVGIENCLAEKAIERRVGCMQSNINYLHQQLLKTNAENRQRLEAANQRLEVAGREIAALKETVVKLQAGMSELQAAAKKAAEPKPK